MKNKLTPKEKSWQMAKDFRILNSTYVNAISSAWMCAAIARDEAESDERIKYWDEVIENLRDNNYTELMWEYNK